MTPNIAESHAASKTEFYQDLEEQVQAVVDGQRNWVSCLCVFTSSPGQQTSQKKKANL